MITTANYYDCLEIRRGPYGNVTSPRLFGNVNVGNALLTNLQVAGQMAGDCTFIVQRWYARTDFEGVVAGPPVEMMMRMFRELLARAKATLVIGNKPTWDLSLADLFQRRPREGETVQVRDPWPTWIPPRQSFSVQLDFFTHILDDVVEVLGNQVCRIWVHLEGVILDDYRSRDSTRGGDVVHALMLRQEQRQSLVTQITDWLVGQQADADPNNRATLEAVRDAILEGRPFR